MSQRDVIALLYKPGVARSGPNIAVYLLRNVQR